MYGVTAGVSAWALLRGQLADMAARGWTVTVVADGDERLELAASREGVRAVPLRMAREISPLQDLKSLVSWLYLLRRERPEVLNVGTPKAALLGAVAGWLTGVPRRIYVVRGLRFEGATGSRRAILVAMERLTIRASTDVVVVSRSVGERMLEVGLDRRPLLLIGEGSSNGVDGVGLAAKAQAVDPSAVRSELGVSMDRFLVGFVGRITFDKGAAFLADAMQILEDRGVPISLVVVGDSEDAAADRHLRSSGAQVTTTGWTDEPWKYIASMDVLVLPTKREGYPNVVLEANACGVPVVTTRATGAIDSVVEGVTGLLVDVDDAPGLADALERLHADPPLRSAMAKAARTRALSDFAPQRIWDGLAAVYRREYSDDVAAVRLVK